MTEAKRENEVSIVIAEDDDGQALLIKEYLEEAGIKNRIMRFSDGQQVLDFFGGILNDASGTVFENAYLVLLDIRMPKVDGTEVLKFLKGHERLKRIPVIMLTTTDDPREVEKCYEAGCNFYITKPMDFSLFAETLKRLGLFLKVVSVSTP